MNGLRVLALAVAVAVAFALAACGEDQFAPGTPEPRFPATPDPFPVQTPIIDPAAP